MSLSLVLLIAQLPAWAGYGDVDDEGYPSFEERGVHFWTNAVRVDPEAFNAEYESSGCTFDDFEESEKTPKQLLYYDRDLNLAGRYHSQDMFDNNWFEHESSDGTSFYDRVARFYSDSGYVGENIAMGYPSPYSAVMHGWMCSSGHRSNIMFADYNELGTGVVGSYYTQDFAAGSVDVDAPVAMAIHDDISALGEASFLADWQDEAAPTKLAVVLDGFGTDLDVLEYGAETLGVYAIRTTPEEEAECHEYYIAWTTEAGAEGTFPEEGSYLYGSGCENDRMWIDRQLGGGALLQQDPDFDPKVDLELIGCTASPLSSLTGRGTVSRSRAPLSLLILLPLLAFRRRPAPSSPR